MFGRLCFSFRLFIPGPMHLDVDHWHDKVVEFCFEIPHFSLLFLFFTFVTSFFLAILM